MSSLTVRLVELKSKNNLLQKDIAHNVGLSLRTYQRYEYGERLPDSDTIIKLCNYFNISADYLLGLTDEPRPLREENTSNNQKQ